MVAKITAAVGAVAAIASKTRGENAYTIVDVNGCACEAVKALNAMDEVYKAYAI